MIQSIQIAHNHDSSVVLTRTGHPPGSARSHIYYHASTASLQRLERLAQTNGFRSLPHAWQIAGWWQREQGAI